MKFLFLVCALGSGFMSFFYFKKIWQEKTDATVYSAWATSMALLSIVFILFFAVANGDLKSEVGNLYIQVMEIGVMTQFIQIAVYNLFSCYLHSNNPYALKSFKIIEPLQRIISFLLMGSVFMFMNEPISITPGTFESYINNGYADANLYMRYMITSLSVILIFVIPFHGPQKYLKYGAIIYAIGKLCEVAGTILPMLFDDYIFIGGWVGTFLALVFVAIGVIKAHQLKKHDGCVD